MSDDSFFNRWSRRKQAVKAGEPVPPEAPVESSAIAAVSPQPPAPNPHSPEAPPAPPAPTLDEAQALTPGNEISRFMQPNVTPDVKNAALKKLFADPHFNVMDGMDTYIDDYSKPDPIPVEMLKRMVGTQLLKIFDDEDDKPPEKPAAPVGTADQAPVAHSSDAQPTPDAAAPELQAHDDHLPDLQLQRDDAARSPADRPSAEPSPAERPAG